MLQKSMETPTKNIALSSPISCRFRRFSNPLASYGKGCAKCQSNVTYEDEENFSTTGSSRVAEDYGEMGFGGVTEDFDNTENGDVSLCGA